MLMWERPSLPLMREVAQRAGGRDEVFSLPQSPSVTAPSSEGAFAGSYDKDM